MTIKQVLLSFVVCTLASALGITIGMIGSPDPILLLGAPFMGAMITLCVAANTVKLDETGDKK